MHRSIWCVFLQNPPPFIVSFWLSRRGPDYLAGVLGRSETSTDTLLSVLSPHFSQPLVADCCLILGTPWTPVLQGKQLSLNLYLCEIQPPSRLCYGSFRLVVQEFFCECSRLLALQTVFRVALDRGPPLRHA